MKTAVLTVNFNGEDKCAKLIDSLKKSTFKDYIIYIVDNGSERANFERLKKLENNKIRVIRSEKNLGWGLGCNVGLRQILKDGIDYTFVVNNDAKIDSRCLAFCMETMENNKKIGICGVKTLTESKKIQTVGGRVNPLSKLTGILVENKTRFKETKPVILEENEFVDDCGWMIRTKKANDMVWYPSHLFMYAEELYINKGIIKKGKVIAFDPRAIIIHENMGSSGGIGNPFTAFYVTRNRHIFMKDYYPAYFPIFLLVHTLLIFPSIVLKYAFKRKWDVVRGVYLGVWSAFVYLATKKKLFLLKEKGSYLIKEIK